MSNSNISGHSWGRWRSTISATIALESRMPVRLSQNFDLIQRVLSGVPTNWGVARHPWGRVRSRRGVHLGAYIRFPCPFSWFGVTHECQIELENQNPMYFLIRKIFWEKSLYFRHFFLPAPRTLLWSAFQRLRVLPFAPGRDFVSTYMLRFFPTFQKILTDPKNIFGNFEIFYQFFYIYFFSKIYRKKSEKMFEKKSDFFSSIDQKVFFGKVWFFLIFFENPKIL